ncbi:helicase [Enterococcus moraviensis ATCC BAA-383]|uniref:Helicase n=1 Tax=Enterococcus moraviensis ATCC BAA-383 TaxID=1158609 RepID=R2QYX0_9ENTE|nr:ATP-dependent DNA helicase [Enterococcus moraviensis]EOI01770.1 helicase [Enterococcus moraviensis ATCC BAA-383]EOT73695.1 helicase [Enterococcus moraviensis ATCC BAA-383]OJG69255.1 helicase [Enterococcus moraviensis]
MQNTQKIAVRRLVEFILRKGSIDARHTSEHTALEGAKIHRALQKTAGDNYQKEIKLAIDIELNKQTYIIEGRADGIFIDDKKRTVIDEIKTSEPAFSELLDEQIDMFWYQVMCYGHIYCQQNDLETITLQLTYFQTTTEEITRQEKEFTKEELKIFFDDLTQKYEQWLIFKANWRKTRNRSLQKLSFPYGEYRAGQRELAVAVYKTILSDQKLFVEAPTGTGKTISTLFPTLKAMGEEQAERVFYLTAKTITRQVAEDAVEAMKQKEMKLKSVTLTAKDKICFLTERNCTPEACPFANGYYDRLNEGLWDLLNNESQFTREVIESYAQKHTLCPFELSLDVSLWCDLVICDYNYLFDPVVYLRRFFEEQTEDKENIFLVDEVHNLVNRSREMYSAVLSKSKLTSLKETLDKKQTKLIRALNKIEKEFDKIKQICDEEEKEFVHQNAPIDSLVKVAYSLAEKIKEWLPENQDYQEINQVLSVYFDLLNYTKISEGYDDHYCTYVNCQNHDILVKQFCIDPSYLLKQKLDKGKASVLFSASLTPLDYYQEILGGGEASLRYRIPSPFPKENQLLVIEQYIQTTYKERESSYEKIIASLTNMIQQKKGNYFVFFPSYAYMDSIYEQFKKQHPHVKTKIQASMMNEAEREAFLADFISEPEETLVGFCVLGGIFSEGIDLKGSRLIGTVIVGVGLPQINHEQELIKEYYDREKNQGFQFAYQIPGMNKVLQAAGRVIRDTNDRGVVLLLDQRFSTNAVKRFFPPHWNQAKTSYSSECTQQFLQQFWQ